MPDLSTIASNLGLAGFAMFILWKMAIMFVQREKEKDAMHAREREEWAKRFDVKDEAFRKLESDIRNTFAVNLMENGNIIKQAIIHLSKKKV